MKPFLTDYYGIAGEKITFIPNGIAPAQKPPLSVAERQELKLRLGFGAEERIILYVGRIDEQKGVFALAEAFSRICASHMNVRLVLVGEGQFLGCLSRVHRMKGRLCFTGFIPAEELDDYFQIADVGILPSLFEQCPYTLLEMARHRIPLIVSQIDGPTEMFGPDECRFFPSGFRATALRASMWTCYPPPGRNSEPHGSRSYRQSFRKPLLLRTPHPPTIPSGRPPFPKRSPPTHGCRLSEAVSGLLSFAEKCIFGHNLILHRMDSWIGRHYFSVCIACCTVIRLIVCLVKDPQRMVAIRYSRLLVVVILFLAIADAPAITLIRVITIEYVRASSIQSSPAVSA
jgi:hypothetical protein